MCTCSETGASARTLGCCEYRKWYAWGACSDQVKEEERGGIFSPSHFWNFLAFWILLGSWESPLGSRTLLSNSLWADTFRWLWTVCPGFRLRYDNQDSSLLCESHQKLGWDDADSLVAQITHGLFASPPCAFKVLLDVLSRAFRCLHMVAEADLRSIW